MSLLVDVGLRALAGGTLVVLFALVGEALTPKRFAGLFGAAPSVALASLAITLAVKAGASLEPAAAGMLVGSVALLVFCVVSERAMRRVSAVAASAIGVGAWLGVAGSLYWVTLR